MDNKILLFIAGALSTLFLGAAFGIVNANEPEIEPTALQIGYHNTLFTEIITNDRVGMDTVTVDGNLRVVGELIGMNSGTFLGITASNYPNDHAETREGVVYEGYEGHSAVCKNEFNNEDAHICSTGDMLASIAAGDLRSDQYGERWANYTGERGKVTQGPSGFNQQPLYDDCNGFTDNTNDHAYRVWRIDNTTGGFAQVAACANDAKIACCG